MQTVAATYRTANQIERRQIRAATVDECRPLVARLVQEIAPPPYREEAAMAGVIGVLVALNKYDPESGEAFERAALREARSEIQQGSTQAPTTGASLTRR